MDRKPATAEELEGGGGAVEVATAPVETEEGAKDGGARGGCRKTHTASRAAARGIIPRRWRRLRGAGGGDGRRAFEMEAAVNRWTSRSARAAERGAELTRNFGRAETQGVRAERQPPVALGGGGEGGGGDPATRMVGPSEGGGERTVAGRMRSRRGRWYRGVSTEGGSTP